MRKILAIFCLVLLSSSAFAQIDLNKIVGSYSFNNLTLNTLNIKKDSSATFYSVIGNDVVSSCQGIASVSMAGVVRIPMNCTGAENFRISIDFGKAVKQSNTLPDPNHITLLVPVFFNDNPLAGRTYRIRKLVNF